MIYGGVKFDKNVNEDVCLDVYNTDYNLAHNCSTVAIPQFESYELTVYYLYRLTFGNSLNEVNFLFTCRFWKSLFKKQFHISFFF
jgi:hypothetical protein